MSKGSKRRPEKGKEYADGWDRIWGKKSVDGAVAQLGERLPCTEEVAGSTPVSSTGPQWRRGRKVMRRIANPNCVGASPTDASLPS